MTQTFNIDAGLGQVNCQVLGIIPKTDGVIFALRNTASNLLLQATSNATPANSTLDVDNGAKLRGFSDTGVTQKWSLDAATGVLKQTGVTVATLPAAATAGAGARLFVTDANATMTAGIGAIVAGAGANNVPVYSDGTNWRIG